MNSEIIKYQNPDGNIKIDVRLEGRNRLANTNPDGFVVWIGKNDPYKAYSKCF